MTLLAKRKMVVFALVVTMIASALPVCAATYANSKSFSVDLPHSNQNVTAASATKTSARDYGKVEITKIGGGSDGVNCWLRSKKADGTWDPLNSKYRSFTKVGVKTVYYTNDDTGYTIPHGKGASVQLRMENITNTQVVKDTVKGTVWFN